MTTRVEKLRKRASRSARSVEHGPQIFKRLQEEDAREAMRDAADEGMPSVSGVSAILAKEFDEGLLKLPPVKSLIGLCVSAIMAEEGYEVAERGVRTDPHVDKMFRTGAVFSKVEEKDEDQPDDAELVDLLVAVGERLLSEDDRRLVIARLEGSL